MKMRTLLLMSLALLAGACGPSPPPAVPVSPAASAPLKIDAILVPETRIADPRLDGCSGIVQLDRTWWAVADSKSGPSLLSDGSPEFAKAETWSVTGVRGGDWEDIAVMDGDLLIADVGDSLRVRPYVIVHRVPGLPFSRNLRPTANYPVKWPERAHDCEAVFVIDRKLHAITKDHGEGTRVMRFDTLQDDDSNVPTVIGQLDLGDGEQVTSAVYDAMSKSVIVLTYTQIARYPEDRLSGAPLDSTLIGARRAEAIAIDGDDLVFCNVERDVFRIERFRDWRYASLLPVRGKTTLSAGVSPIPLTSAVPGESASWWLAADGIHIDVRLRVDGEPKAFDVERGKPGTGFLACFARDAARRIRPQDVMLAVTADGQGGAAVHRATFDGGRALDPVAGAIATMRSGEGFVAIEAVVPETSIAREPLPPKFLFDLYAYEIGRDDGARHSGPNLWAMVFPYLWGDCERR